MSIKQYVFSSKCYNIENKLCYYQEDYPIDNIKFNDILTLFAHLYGQIKFYIKKDWLFILIKNILYVYKNNYYYNYIIRKYIFINKKYMILKQKNSIYKMEYRKDWQKLRAIPNDKYIFVKQGILSNRYRYIGDNKRITFTNNNIRKIKYGSYYYFIYKYKGNNFYIYKYKYNWGYKRISMYKNIILFI